MYENMPKTGISMSKNTIIFHFEAYYCVIQTMIVSLVLSKKCPFVNSKEILKITIVYSCAM